MAALDFGMALARGMLPTAKKSQEDLLNLAGGRNIFKSEDWWNKAVDKQVSEGYRKQDYQKQYLVDTGLEKSLIRDVPSGILEWRPEKTTLYGHTTAPKGAVQDKSKPFSMMSPRNYMTREVSLGFSTSRDYFKAPELKDIEKSAKVGAQRAKREMAQSKASRSKLQRGTGGLLAKASIGPESTGLSPLGVTGLGLDTDTLGRKVTL
jgi:hypothetical protein